MEKSFAIRPGKENDSWLQTRGHVPLLEMRGIGSEDDAFFAKARIQAIFAPYERKSVMAIEIKRTPVLEGESARDFLKSIKEPVSASISKKDLLALLDRTKKILSNSSK